MSERFSIKGKGAELFFGEDDGHATEPTGPTEVPATQPGIEIGASTAAQPPSQQATMPPRAQQQTMPSAERESHDLIWRLRDALREDHALHYSYRFTREEIDGLRDVVYELEAKRGIRSTRNDIVRLGLDWILDDYRARGKESLLVQVLKEEKWGDRR
jgi:hypothetical protein